MPPAAPCGSPTAMTPESLVTVVPKADPPGMGSRVSNSHWAALRDPKQAMKQQRISTRMGWESLSQEVDWKSIALSIGVDQDTPDANAFAIVVAIALTI